MATDLENARSGNHVPALDGVRGLAILAVLTYHSAFYSGSRSGHVVDATFRQLMSFGWSGVDLFFVLSGLLITGILLDSRESPQYYRSFYARRVLRIFPLYFVFLAGFIWLLPLVREMEPQFATMKQEQVWYWTYLINVRVAMEGWPDVKLLGHFWSLAVEEQFYLVWPFLVLSCSRATLYRVCVGCIVGALALRIWLLFNGHPVAAYVLPFARLDSLAMGGLLAIWVRDPGAHMAVARYAPKVLLACCGLIAGIFVIKGAFWPWGPFVHTLGLSIVALASSSLIATVLFRPDARWLGGIFRSSPMRFLGKYSYGIYVVHHPVIMILGRSRLGASEWPTWGGAEILGQLFVLVAGGAFSVILALVSWNLLEAPMLRLKDRFPYWPS